MNRILDAAICVGSDRARGLPRLLAASTLALVAGAGAGPAAALDIHPVFDASVTSQVNAALIESAFNTVAAQYDAAFSNPVTVNINVSWGMVAGQALPGGAIGASLDPLDGYYQYSDVQGFLSAASLANPGNAALATAVANLPATDPTGFGFYVIPYAEEKALGILPANLPGFDAYVGFRSGVNFDFNPAGGITRGAYDFEGLAGHEIAEALGRITGLQYGGTQWVTPFDDFRYTADGVSSYAYNAHAYFSIDGGTTSQGAFNYWSSGDRSDWYPNPSDEQTAYFYSGRPYGLSANDVTALEALGWGGAAIPGGPTYGFAVQSIPGDLELSVGVPEPATWAMLLAGFCAVGAATRGKGRRARRTSGLPVGSRA